MQVRAAESAFQTSSIGSGLAESTERRLTELFAEFVGTYEESDIPAISAEFAESRGMLQEPESLEAGNYSWGLIPDRAKSQASNRWSVLPVAHSSRRVSHGSRRPPQLKEP
jgi:hypothetical protein